MKRIVVLILVLITAAGAAMKQEKTKTKGSSTAAPKAGASAPNDNRKAFARDDRGLENELVTKYGEGQRERIRRGVKQVAEFWRAEDGDRKAFEEFVKANFASSEKTKGPSTRAETLAQDDKAEVSDLDQVFSRFERLLEQIDGHTQEMGREFRTQADLDVGRSEERRVGEEGRSRGS